MPWCLWIKEKKITQFLPHFFPITPPYFSGCGPLQFVPEGELKRKVGWLIHVSVYKSAKYRHSYALCYHITSARRCLIVSVNCVLAVWRKVADGCLSLGAAIGGSLASRVGDITWVLSGMRCSTGLDGIILLVTWTPDSICRPDQQPWLSVIQVY